MVDAAAHGPRAKQKHTDRFRCVLGSPNPNDSIEELRIPAFYHKMAQDPDLAQESASLSRIGLYHCKAGQETVQDIVTRTVELFNYLKVTSLPQNPILQKTPENEAKRAKIKDLLSAIQYKFDTLRRHYNYINDNCSSLAYVQVKSLIPFKDDPDNVEQIQKHRRNLCVEPQPEIVQEKEELIKKIAERDEQLRKITNDLRDFVYEINTMLHISKS